MAAALIGTVLLPPPAANIVERIVTLTINAVQTHVDMMVNNTFPCFVGDQIYLTYHEVNDLGLPSPESDQTPVLIANVPAQAPPKPTTPPTVVFSLA